MAAAVDMGAEPGAGLHQEALADFIQVRTDEIDRGERLRELDVVWAKALGAMMVKDGQQTPIQVSRLPGRNRWTLVVGAHRHLGAELAGLEYLKAEVVSADRDGRRLREVIENLGRRDLDPLDRAAFIAELVQIKRAKAGLMEAGYRETQAIHGLKKAVARETAHTLDTMSRVYGWTKEVGSSLGFADRTIRRDLELYRGLPASLIAKLRAARHPILSNAAQLRALVKLAPAERDAAVEAMMGVDGKGQPIGLPLARAMTGTVSAPADPEAKRLSAFIGSFQRMSLAEKKGALAQLAGMLPAGTSIGQPAKATFHPEHERYREEALAAIDGAREVIDGIVEDDILPGDRGSDLRRVSGDLQMTRFSVVANAFDMGRSA